MTKAQTLLQRAIAELKLTKVGYKELKLPASGHWAAALRLLDELHDQLQPPKPKPRGRVVLGPVTVGGASILDLDLTHITDGFHDGGSRWPALDDGLGHPGRRVIAPERVRITGHGRALRRSGAPNGQSINIAVGASGMEYWIGHIENPAPVGATVAKGGTLGVISANHEAPHVHVGINARKLLGHDLAHHADYTHGAPKIGVQLRAAGYATD